MLHRRCHQHAARISTHAEFSVLFSPCVYPNLGRLILTYRKHHEQTNPVQTCTLHCSPEINKTWSRERLNTYFWYLRVNANCPYPYTSTIHCDGSVRSYSSAHFTSITNRSQSRLIPINNSDSSIFTMKVAITPMAYLFLQLSLGLAGPDVVRSCAFFIGFLWQP